jgi:putative hemolysin
MAIVSSNEISKFLHIQKYGRIGDYISKFFLKITRISKLNFIYDSNKKYQKIEFLDNVLKDLNVQIQIPEEDLKRIPKEGSFITVSNHPLGGIDGVVLLKILLEARSDYKLIANFLLDRIEPLQPYILPVNPFDTHKNVRSSVRGLRGAMEHLKNGAPLGVFPAGEVSTKKHRNIYVDKEWEDGALRLLKKANVAVVPIYFHAKNSKLFYFLSKISPWLRTLKLPSELIGNKPRIIKVRIGKPVSIKKQTSFSDYKELGLYLRNKTYLFSNTFGSKALMLLKKKAKQIITPISEKLLIEEIIELRKQKLSLFSTEGYEAFFVKADRIPNLLRELGRLREITFRNVGEGTNEPLDLDIYDTYYHHLFLWDTNKNKIIGAYRMGLGASIFKKYGKDGFYLNGYFGFHDKLNPMLKHSIELGRAFVIKEYQQKTLPLFLLWKGVLELTLKYPKYKYLFGSVSISSQFSNFSKSLIVEFVKKNFHDKVLTKSLKTKNEFKPVLHPSDKEFIFEDLKLDLNALDKLIDELEPGSLRLPVLIKKYIKQNVKVLTFTVDPDFNNSVDGLMYVKIEDIPEVMMNIAREK